MGNVAKLAEIEAPVYASNERKIIGASASHCIHQRLDTHTCVTILRTICIVLCDSTLAAAQHANVGG